MSITFIDSMRPARNNGRFRTPGAARNRTTTRSNGRPTVIELRGRAANEAMRMRAVA